MLGTHQPKQPQPIVGENETALFDPYQKYAEKEMKKKIEEELCRVAANNWPNATKVILRNFKDLEFKVDWVFYAIQLQIEHQLLIHDDYDDYTDVLWALVKSKKYSDTARCPASAVAIMLGRFWLLHAILKQGPAYPTINGSEKRPQADRILGHKIGHLNKVYSQENGFWGLLEYALLDSFPKYKRNKGLFPRVKEPCYKNWKPVVD